MTISPPSSGQKSRPSKKLAEAGRKLSQTELGLLLDTEDEGDKLL
jgi:hypothetical protein